MADPGDTRPRDSVPPSYRAGTALQTPTPTLTRPVQAVSANTLPEGANQPRSAPEIPVQPQRLLRGPASEAFSPPFSLPTVKVGTGLQPPGEWAAYVLKLNWSVATIGNKPKSSLLQNLLQLAPRNELSIRFKERRNWSPAVMNEKIGRKLVNVEAAVMQIMGTENPAGCVSCQNGHGPFSHCVTVPSTPACANCHWNGQAGRCSIPATPIPTPAPTGPRRTYSEEKRIEWNTKMTSLKEQLTQLKERDEGVKAQIRKLRTQVNAIGLTFSHLAFSESDRANVWERGCKAISNAQKEIDDLEAELMSISAAEQEVMIESIGLLGTMF